MTTHVANGLVFAFAAALAAAQPPAGVKELGFLAGHWSGTVEGFQADEIWSPAANGSLMGVYREMKDGKTTFFEFLTIEEENVKESAGEAAAPVLRLRHFKPGMKPLETDPIVFNLASFSPGKAVFENGAKALVRITFEKKGPDHMDVLLERKRENGEWTHELFAYTRLDP